LLPRGDLLILHWNEEAFLYNKPCAAAADPDSDDGKEQGQGPPTDSHASPLPKEFTSVIRCKSFWAYAHMLDQLAAVTDFIMSWFGLAN